MYDHIWLKWNAKFPFMQNIKCSWWVAHPALFHSLAILSQFSEARVHVFSKPLITGTRTRSTLVTITSKNWRLDKNSVFSIISWDPQQLGKCLSISYSQGQAVNCCCSFSQLKELLKPVKSCINNFSILHVLNVRLVAHCSGHLSHPWVYWHSKANPLYSPKLWLLTNLATHSAENFSVSSFHTF